MFSGIVEAQSKSLKVIPRDEVVEIHLAKPSFFDDLKIGQSICINGICLSIETFNEFEMSFAIAHETLKVTSWTKDILEAMTFNLERSLKMSDRIHGHIVTGHVDKVGQVVESYALGENWILSVDFGSELIPYIWKKGSVALNGVSLTVNDVTDTTLSVCLIPETTKQTNLGELKAGDPINVEIDFMARGLVHTLKNAPQLVGKL